MFATVGRIGPASVAEVHAEIQRSRKTAYTTVMTALVRLARKDLLVRSKQDRRFIYAVATEGAAAARIRGVFSSLIADFGQVAIRQFVDTVSETDAAALDELERQVRRARGDKGSGA